MVSLVLVSHSKQLAEGVRELAQQMTQGRVKIAVAGGTSDGRLGTDATVIQAAIETLGGQPLSVYANAAGLRGPGQMPSPDGFRR